MEGILMIPANLLMYDLDSNHWPCRPFDVRVERLYIKDFSDAAGHYGQSFDLAKLGMKSTGDGPWVSSPVGEEIPDPLPGSAFTDGCGSCFAGGAACFFRVFLAPEASEASALGAADSALFLMMTSDKVFEHEREGRDYDVLGEDDSCFQGA
ncbi:unnamed protein product [Sphagnum tenellum]